MSARPCPACTAYDAAEREAIADDAGTAPLPDHTVDASACTCVEPEIDVLVLSPEQFARAPQVGTPERMTWPALLARLARATMGDPDLPDDEAKRGAGSWSPCFYRGNARAKKNVISCWAITFDIDVGGDVDRACRAFDRFQKIVHSTYKSTPEAPRCRVVLPLAAPCADPAQYEAAHALMRRELGRRGLTCDDGAKDISRLNFWPMVRPGREFHVRSTDGAPFDLAGFARAAEADTVRRRAAAQPDRTTAPSERPAYVRASLQRAAGAILLAVDGDRHHQLAREAFTLARPALGLSFAEVRGALLEAFVLRAGESRRVEGERTIRDAYRAARTTA